MSFIVGALGNCTTNFLGTGLGQCDMTKLGDAKAIILHKKGWSKAISSGSVSFGLTEHIADIKKLHSFPLLGAYDFALNTPENEQHTSSTQVKSVIREGKPEFTFMFDKGTCFHKSLWNKRGQDLWDISFLFEAGWLVATSSDGTSIKGFDAGMFNVETYKFLSGSEREGSTATIQLLNADEFNARSLYVPYTSVGDLDLQDGIIEADVEIVGTPASSDTDLSVKVTYGCNNSNTILDLAGNNFALTGAAANGFTSSVYNATTGNYDLTVPALGTGSLQVKLNDGTDDVAVDSLGAIYKGISEAVTVS